jgi:MFS family permease
VKHINRTVLILSLVSLFADVASEMLYPVIPVYLKEIGFSVLLIGTLEGVVNFIAGLTKGYFGKLSDEKGLRLPFVRWGYLLSAVSKPMTAFATWVPWVFFVRSVDRLGKGMRTSARDALLVQNSTPETKARVFGFHRALDTTGAAIGPAVALLLLALYPHNYPLLFYIAFIPGLLSILLLFLLKEQKVPQSTLGRGGFFSFFKYWKIATPGYKKLAAGLLLFALFNSADVFLLLRTKEVTGSDTVTIGAYILYNVVFAIASYPLGALADRFGIRKVFISGLVLFAIVYLLFGFAGTPALLFAGFVLYGIYAAATEGISKAWLAHMAPTDSGTALGFFNSCQSICTMLASVLTGALWSYFNSSFAFTVTAVAAVFVAIYIHWNVDNQ